LRDYEIVSGKTYAPI
jgi:hypothetical protein